MANSPRRHFLSWDRPLLPQAAIYLAGDWTGPAPLDLSRLLVVVPTRQSGRRLREALAEYAAERKSAVFPPRVLTPEAMLVPTPGQDAPSRLESLLAWIDVLQGAEWADFRAVVPHDPPTRNFGWAMRLADQFGRIQAALAENGLRMSDVAGRVGPDFSELDRWQQLGALEQRQIHRLRQIGRRDQLAVLADPTGSPDWLADTERVVVLATADPVSAAITLLEVRACALPIDVVVYAPEAEADHFDAWGRPVAPAWTDRLLPIADFEQRVHVSGDPSAQSIRIANLAHEYRAGSRRPDGWLAIGIADPEILAGIEGEAVRHGVPVYNPEGRRHRDGPLYQLLSAVAQAARSPTFEAVVALARCPDFGAYLERRIGGSFSMANFLRALDDLNARHLPADLAAARRHAPESLSAVLAAIEDMLATIASEPFPEGVSTVLGTLFEGRRVDPRRDDGARLQDAAAAWTSVMRECAAARAAFGALGSFDWWELALRAFGDARVAEDKPAGALDLQGWLELTFEDAPHLVIGGFNDGLVPDAIAGDAFLPESLRLQLGLKSNAMRLARDAYLLHAIIASRNDAGRVDLLLGKTSAAGDLLRPSRLLFRCPDAELPARIAFLFRTPEIPDSHLPWTRAWKLRPERVTPPTQVAVTSLRRWLACPFRFYLRSALRMEAVDAAKTEMDAFDFGTLCHTALEAMGREPALRDCTDPAVLREFLLTEVARNARARYGAELSLPLSIQLESARQRLGKVAVVQARERVAGWVIQDVERAFAVEIAGVTVKGKIDRIDRNDVTGAVRVLDYKTSDTGIAPMSAHLRNRRSADSVPDWQIAPGNGKPRVWTDLQLPLYRHALATKWGESIGCGYVNLPKAVGQTAVALWDDASAELQASAMRCAEGVCAAIRAGKFWPPNEEIRADADEYAALFHHGVAESVDWRSEERADR